MIINSHSIKLTGKAELSEPLEIDKNYKVILQGSIISSADHSNQNGTADRTYILKPVLVELIDEIGVTIKVKDMRKMSQKLRGTLRKEWQESGENIDEEKYYEREMNGIIRERFDRN